MSSISERTAIALQDHAAYQSRLWRVSVELLHDGRFPSDGFTETWLCDEQAKVAELYALCHHHRDVASNDFKLGRAVGEFLYSPDTLAFDALERAHEFWQEGL